MTRTGNSRNIFSEQNFQNFKNLFKICIEIYISVLPEGLASVLFAQGVGYNEITPYSTKNILYIVQYYQILTEIVFQILIDIVRFCQIYLDIVKYVL